jgi:hypothetical protein
MLKKHGLISLLDSALFYHLTLHVSRCFPLSDIIHDGDVLGILVQRLRDRTAAKALFRKLLRECGTFHEGCNAPTASLWWWGHTRDSTQ